VQFESTKIFTKYFDKYFINIMYYPDIIKYEKENKKFIIYSQHIRILTVKWFFLKLRGTMNQCNKT